MEETRFRWRVAGGGSFKLKGKPETGKDVREMHYFR